MRSIVALTAATTLLGVLGWPRPEYRSETELEIFPAAPVLLWILLAGSAVTCLAVAVALTLRTSDLRTTEPAALGLWLIFIVSAGALVWNALYSAALSTVQFGALIPMFHWLFTFLPAVLAMVLVARRSRRTRLAAALATGVVTLPLFALGGSLLFAPDFHPLAVLGSLLWTGLIGVAPFIAGIAAVVARWDDQPPPPHTRSGVS